MVFSSHHLQIFCLLLCFTQFLCIDSDLNIQEDSDFYAQFKDFKLKYNKSYSSTEELYHRYEIFKSNLQTIFNHKILNPKADYGVTFFADLTSEEFHSNYLKMHNPEKNDKGYYDLNFIAESVADLGADIPIPETFDWREKGVNEEIESQGICWSCWAFTTVTNVESLYYIKFGEKIKLSEQQLIDCDTKNDGCKGGLMTTAYDYIINAGGLMLV